MSYVVRPISDRTPFHGVHKPSPFESSLGATEEVLFREVKMLNGRDLVVEVDVAESQIRQDGLLYARAQAASPAVRVAFDSRHGPLQYATDRFNTWQANLRAIALGLEALRKIERYGVAQHGQQYTGWKALPAGSGAAPSAMTSDEAWSILGSFGDGTIAEQRTRPDQLPRSVRRARAFAHPDRHDGDRTLWDQVEHAASVLGVTR